MPIEIDLSSAKFDGHLGLPYPVRFGLLKVDLAEVSLALDALFCSGVVSGTEFQLAEAMALIRAVGLKTPESTIRRGLRNKIFNPVPLPYKRVGPREFQYTMPELTTLIEKYGRGK